MRKLRIVGSSSQTLTPAGSSNENAQSPGAAESGIASEPTEPIAGTAEPGSQDVQKTRELHPKTPRPHKIEKQAQIDERFGGPPMRSREQRIEEGKAFRESVPRAAHATWKRPGKERDPIAALKASNRDRLPELISVRYGRMLKSPFTFLRGSAGLMASDLSTTPNTGIKVQACGDCHLLNFGLFATPERNLIFDINDFDETLPAPWEWDIKRLAISFVVAARDIGLADRQAKAAAAECVRAYHNRMREFSEMSPLEVWYDRLDAQTIIEMAPNAKIRKLREQMVEQAQERIGDYLYPKISGEVGGRRRLVDVPPVLFHVSAKGWEKVIRDALKDYRLTLPDERKVLFDRYRMEDIAIKAVGIGSVGTR